MHKFLLPLLIFCMIFTLSCNEDDSATGTAPEIYNLSISPSSLIVDRGGGAATLTGTFDFIDPDGDVATWKIRFDDGTEFETALLDTEGLTSGTITVSFTASTTDSGTKGFQVWVVDTGGNPSNQLDGTYVVEMLTFTGTGSENTDTFHSIGGWADFALTHDGNSSFIVQLLDSNGSQVESLANASGDFSDTKSVYLTEGDYSFSVNADGNWSIAISGNIERSTAAASDGTGDSADLSFSGSGDDVTAIFHSAGGRAVFTITHDGTSSFWVELQDNITGEQVGLSLVINTGEYSGNISRELPEGDYVINVTADGNWTIDIEGNVSLTA